MNISPHKLIQEPQMSSCSSHLSNKNVLTLEQFSKGVWVYVAEMVSN